MVFYVIPLIYLWWFHKTIYSPKGKFKNSTPDGSEVFITLIPIVNFIAAFVYLLFDGPYELTKKNKRTFANYFFCVKKDKTYEQD